MPDSPEALKRFAQYLISQTVMAYAVAEQKLIDLNASQREQSRAAEIQAEVREFFSEGEENLFLVMSELGVDALQRSFAQLVQDPERLSSVAKVRYAG